ncbi:uncharacterized protein Z520_00288 [Fonsecaea multimorphosa CBS 102226]|uniref:Uncharacterized protein n=1 Tax=Fonsecaea multimorphosa CBS 102226 TaxID=1442371 RepID=A0A0D2J2E6_9EURO|nr:uncharacterized protein Z520_00288 [Fonsecaea multimorphosa CBS 102226]KIY03597.1 hypothetical protein Z520_00288 [Fonsecaea multimorphosa CBS 102226]OAL32298.1 hypothetical protein AYO22_00320 [Fonsecaea multimorphosa]
MSRSPSVTPYGNGDLSSPDPLATSVNDEASHGSITLGSRQPASKRQYSSTAMKTTGRPASTNTFKYEAAPSSPFRTVSEQNLSPWKIRVTVEAEPEDADMEGNASLMKPRARATQRSLQHEFPEDGGRKTSARGKNSNSHATRSKRSETPGVDRKNCSRSRRQSVTDLDIIPLGDDSEEDDWLKQKKSPRKRRNSRKSVSAAASSTQEASPSKSSRANPSASRFEVRPDTDIEDNGDVVEQTNVLAESQSPELRKINPNRVSVRPRALSTKPIVGNDFENEDSIVNEKTRSTSVKQQIAVRKVSVNSALSYPTPSPTSSYHGDSDDVGKALDDDDAPRRHENEAFDTILESEGFTMIDLDTLPSVRRALSSPLDVEPPASLHPSDINDLETLSSAESGETGNGDVPASNPAAPLQAVTYPTIKPDESELSSTVPSSPPALEKDQGLLKVPSSSVSVGRKVTPLPYSSPKLPSPPRPKVRWTPQHQHRASAGAVFAGIALQEVVSPDRSGERALAGKQDTFSNHPGLEEDGALFVGFDCGTQRELRAGLRFGEELAKRLTSPPENQSASSKDKGSESNEISNAKVPVNPEQHPRAQVWRGENLVQHTPIHTSSSKGRSGEGSVVHTPPNPPREYTEKSILDTQARREREWQLEREAVSRQIQNASESQVIVIDSDDEEEQPTPRAERQESSHLNLEVEADDETDIWLAEAKNSSSPGSAVQSNTESLFTHTEQVRQRQRAQEVINRPRRSLIPSPWKRGENVDAPQEQSTLLSGIDDVSSLMFYNEPQSKIRFGAGEIKRQQLRLRRNSGKFDIDLMAGTPRGKPAEHGIVDSEDMVVSEEEELEEDAPVALDQSTPTAEAEAPTAHDELDEVVDLANEISQSSGSPYSSPQPVKIPVNFNDSSISISTPPPRPNQFQAKPFDGDAGREDSPARPPTPRSAMKGSRYSFNQGLGIVKPDATDMIRKVVFSQRSRGVDIDGQESSFSMRSSTDDSFEDSVGVQLHRELQLFETETRQTDDGPPAVVEGDLETQRKVSVRTEAKDEPSVTNPSKGWPSWIWRSNQTSDRDSQTQGWHNTDGPGVPIKPTMSSSVSDKSQDQSQSSGWERTKASISSSTKTSEKAEAKSQPIPSYLIPPSYPSDPLRSSKRPLALSGAFSNTHFRTLHIIYRKSLRPKFHAPPHAMIRPEVRALKGTEMVIDESANGLVKGEFAWTVGDGESEVLERFMQECEYSHGWYKGRQIRADAAEIKWGWSVEQLAEWLCRIVVGEVVREEEKKAKGR